MYNGCLNEEGSVFMYLRQNWQTTKGRRYKYYKIVKSTWLPDLKKNKQTVIHYLGSLSNLEAEQIRLVLKVQSNHNKKNNKDDNDDEVIVTKLKNIIYEDAYSFLEIVVIFHFWKFWNFDELFNALPDNNSRELSHNLIIKILVTNRCLNSLSNQNIPSWVQETVIPFIEKGNLKKLNETRIHRTLEWLYSQREKLKKFIRKSVVDKYPDKVSEIYCDLAGIVFEGTKIGDYNCYNRAVSSHSLKKKLVLWAVVTEEGYILDWEVLQGNITGIETLKKQVKNTNEIFPDSNKTIIFDRGMVSEEILDLPFFNNKKYITGVKQNQIKKIMGKKYFELEKIPDDLYENNNFSIESILNFKQYKNENIYLSDVCEKNKRRYILGFNKLKWREDRNSRTQRMYEFEEEIKVINTTLAQSKKSKNKEILINEVFEKARKKRVKSFYEINFNETAKSESTIQNYEVILNKKTEYLKTKKLSDGLFMLVTNKNEIQTDASNEEIKAKDTEPQKKYITSKEKILFSYRSKDYVEKAFQNLHSFVKLEPVRHSLKNKIISHVDICIMSYLINITIYNILKSHKTIKFGYIESIYKELKKCSLGKIKIKNNSKDTYKLNIKMITKKQKEMLKKLKCSNFIKNKYIQNLNIQK
jgi:hypothetical protein